ncbi:hypothetical protein ENUP19_0284G0067 [Entamoeba nuttalli]|uniref:Uncharacterized protein n=2 Tax=Entamoeba nuttalli TaxID=412467 RepID=K2GWC9_ENTNP|nr:hypothetical protein ENU1_124930 [Entamoeba nuttalli P19]EKE39528.1 hypothetical protein ENU1_124930 [Entamoeba nuttalli P19]|eukprot:XP_008858145.1 hypothetical protein ENU1_124930 [Entamoeba nuttalli P19]
MNFCIFNIENVSSLYNEDYFPNRRSHIIELIHEILKANYFNSYAVVLSDKLSTMYIAPTNDFSAIDSLYNIKPTSEQPHHLRCLRKSLFISKQQHCHSVHIVSFITSEEALSDVVLRQTELQTLRSYHVQFVLLGDVLNPLSHTRSLVRSLVKRQSRGWGVTENDLTKTNPYERLMMRMSEGIIILPRRKVLKQLPHMRAGQVPCESKAGKFISCKVITHMTNDTVSMIPVPIISKQKNLSTIRCGKSNIVDGKCVSSEELGMLFLVELSPILFKLIWKTENEIDHLTIFYGETSCKQIKKGGYNFLIFEGNKPNGSLTKTIYWTTLDAKEFCTVFEKAMSQDVPQNYIKIMQTIWNDNKKTLSSMEEKYMSMKREKEIVNKMDEYVKGVPKTELNRKVRNEADKKTEPKEPSTN